MNSTTTGLIFIAIGIAIIPVGLKLLPNEPQPRTRISLPSTQAAFPEYNPEDNFEYKYESSKVVGYGTAKPKGKFPYGLNGDGIDYEMIREAFDERAKWDKEYGYNPGTGTFNKEFYRAKVLREIEELQRLMPLVQ